MKADYMIFIVGTNPLPNLIAADKFLDDHSQVFLIYTEGSDNIVGTNRIKDHIAKTLKKRRPNLTIQSFATDKSNPIEIKHTIDKIMLEIKKQGQSFKEKTIALNYTGGTKTMAALSYHQNKKYMKEIFKNDEFYFLFSYVDGEIGKILYEFKQQYHADEINKMVDKYDRVLEDIVEIHGYELIHAEELETAQEYAQFQNVTVRNVEQPEMVIHFDEVYVHGYQLTCLRKDLQPASKNMLKFKIFQAKDHSEKIGGEQVRLFYICNYQDKNGNLMRTEPIENELSESQRINLKDRIRIMNSADVNQQEIEKLVKGL
ncbi:hypothetical protein [Tepidibacillus fermentans]|uniref:Card1 CARF domain-containing protein n=1 Tax=Tepidibacillus fermentans TaxID=1281767 RepID=A0A4R3K7U1_9BACI|nr:hypothetical protein [Tepidibacillus fermentans]TCS78937.1 hypothetical protein EDD72_12416 [Tepidibacillus fermentans]